MIGQECLDQLELAGEYPDVVDRLRRRRLQLRRGRLPVPAPQAARRPRHALPRGRAGGLPDPDPWRVPLRLRRHRRDDPADADVHARPRLRPAASSTPAACATTATRRCVSALVKEGLVEAAAIPQTSAFEAAVRFAGVEGILPAPEPAHAIRAVIDEAEAAKEAGEERVILFNLCGHGHFDMSAYDAYHRGELDRPRVLAE